ncbi:hypothetical protein CBR_g12845 [Chara braunii]|uniref:DUF659 domain-containing protein n=1 Tax=Chara braunii TaxID=69332 RepID=A0A388KT04_CHABU|nr:hypothetical protein CBR_g12845 [Chara braunii]|eukprot:GBG73128.1 hypothetical protein CBR_g12845 [Chara braunii]
MIEEMYDKEKLAEFTDTWLQWIYVKGLPFNAFRGSEFSRVWQATERVPHTIQFRFPSYRVTVGAVIPSQKAKVATMVSEVRAAFRHTGATILSDGRKLRRGKPLVNFLAGGANGALLNATVARDGSVRDTADIVYLSQGPTRCVESMLHGDAWARIPWERRLVSQAQWVQQQIRDGEFWRCVQYAILVMAPVHELLRRMDRGGMMMSVVYEWIQHVLRLTRTVNVPANMLEPCVREVAIRNLHTLEPAHAAAHLLNPRRRSLTYYESLQTTVDDARVVEECTDFSWRRLAAIRSADSKRNWVQHERINTARHCKLGFAKLAQLVEIATNLKLASCTRQGGGYVLPWVMGTGREGTAAEDEDEEGDVELVVCGARPAGSVPEQDIQQQIANGSTRPGGRRGGRSHVEVGVDDSGEQDPRGGLRQTGRRWEVRSDSEAEEEAEDEQVPFRDRRFSPSHHLSTAQPEALRRSERLASTAGRDRTHDGEDRRGERTPSDAGIRPRLVSELRTHDFDIGGLGGGLGDFSAEGRRRASLSEVRTDEDVVRDRVETEEEWDARLDREEEERLRSLPGWEGRSPYLEEQHWQRELETGGGGGRDADDSGVPEEAV